MPDPYAKRIIAGDQSAVLLDPPLKKPGICFSQAGLLVVHCWRVMTKTGTTSFASRRAGNSCSRPLTCWVVLLASLSRMPAPAASEETDCRAVTGNTTGPAPVTCTVQLTLGSTEIDIISSLRATCEEFPLKCHSRKYRACTLYPLAYPGFRFRCINLTKF